MFDKYKKFEQLKVVNIILSHKVLAFFYGIFIFLYQLKFFEECITVAHPILIVWAFFIAVYDIFVRKIWRVIPLWQPLVLFVLSAGITGILTREAGIVLNIKVWVMVTLPLSAFYPVCLLEKKEKRTEALLHSLSGAAVVMCISSIVSLWMYAVRFSQKVTFMGITQSIGISHYVPEDPSSAVILYGIYKDTNYAASYAVVFIVYSLMLLAFCRRGGYQEQWKNQAARIFAVVNLIVQILYFPLANSRGGWVSMCVSIFIVMFLYVFCNWQKQRKICVKALLSLAGSIAAVFLCGLIILVSRTGMSAVSMKIESGRLDKQQEKQIADKTLNKSKKEVKGENQNNDDENNHVKENPANPTDSRTDSESVSEKNSADTTQAAEDSFNKQNAEIGAGRIEIWKDALKLFKNRPFWGEGSGNNVYYAKKYSPDGRIALFGKMIHNSYLDLLVDYGIIGTVLLLSFWVGCMAAVLKHLLWKKKELSIFAYFCMVNILMGAGSAFLLSYLFVNTTAMYFLLLVSVGYLMSECVPDLQEREDGAVFREEKR